jgi:hypothetical protein
VESSGAGSLGRTSNCLTAGSEPYALHVEIVPKEPPKVDCEPTDPYTDPTDPKFADGAEDSYTTDEYMAVAARRLTSGCPRERVITACSEAKSPSRLGEGANEAKVGYMPVVPCETQPGPLTTSKGGGALDAL